MSLSKHIPRRMRQSGRTLLLKKFGLAFVKQKPLALLTNPRAELMPTLDIVVAHYIQRKGSMHFLQIGAFDGVSGDSLYPLVEKYRLSGTLVEPQYDAFCRLKLNYAKFDQKTFNFIHAAIADTDSTRELFRIRAGEGRPEWLPQVATFDKAVLMQQAGPGLRSSIETEEVRCIQFETLFREHRLPHVDLLQIDAEGYDAELLRLFDLPARRPAIVRYEHKHLRREIQEQTVEALIRQDYQVCLSLDDTLAYCPHY